MPGGAASFIDTLPGKPGLALANFFSYYNGSASASKELPTGGLITSGLEATAYVDTLVALYQTSLKLLGGHYAVGAAVPYVWMEVDGEVQMRRPPFGTLTRTMQDKANGVGDILLYPFMLGWSGLGGELKTDVRLGVYSPTGEYDKGNIANVGKNYWTFEPAASLNYISSKTGFEATVFAGVDFNTDNDDTDYQSGTQFHLDVTLAEHLPFLGGLIGLGVNGFYYEQISADSGSGAVLGDFKARTVGAGPVLSFATQIGKRDFVAELKWLPEFDVKNRLDGDYVWFKLGMVF